MTPNAVIFTTASIRKIVVKRKFRSFSITYSSYKQHKQTSHRSVKRFAIYTIFLLKYFLNL